MSKLPVRISSSVKTFTVYRSKISYFTINTIAYKGFITIKLKLLLHGFPDFLS